MRSLRLTASAIFLLAIISFAQAQHLGSRQQWQPQTENDPRLQQPVHIEIVGRAAVTGLPILSEKTGVKFTVAPEDLATVGERKFTVIAQGCSLKAIMVQLCEALQECHWDVEGEGYVLHRNGSLEESVAAQTAGTREQQDEARRSRLQARIDEARAALDMDDEQLAQLEKTDPVLALTMRNPEARNAVEAFLNLPETLLQQFLEKGELRIRYADASSSVQRAAVWGMGIRLKKQRSQRFRWREGDGGNPEGMLRNEQELERKLARMDEMVLEYRESTGWTGSGVKILLHPESDENQSDFVKLPTLPPVHPLLRHEYFPLLAAKGELPGETETETVETWEEQGRRLYLEAKQQQETAQVLRDSEEARKTLSFDREVLRLHELQIAVSDVTGWSVISDYFTDEFGASVNASEELTIREWVSRFGRRGRGLAWRQVGQCLVCHHLDWHELSQAEIPERLLTPVRKKLAAHEAITLEDLVAVAEGLQGRPQARTTPPVPSDLANTGVCAAANPSERWALVLYGSLSPEQLTAAKQEAGLGYAEMTKAQEALVEKVLRRDSELHFEGGPSPVAPEVVRQARFQVREGRTRKGKPKISFLLSADRLYFPVSVVPDGPRELPSAK